MLMKLDNLSFAEAEKIILGRNGKGNSHTSEADKKPGKRAKIVEVYPYFDEAGNLLFEVVRKEPKSFLQRRPDGKGGHIWNMEDARLVPYNLPAVIKAAEIHVCEGEKGANAVNSLFEDNPEIAATCSPGGAGKWREGYNEHFRGKGVVIYADNDEAGRNHALQVATSLNGIAASVRIVHLPGLPEKGDIYDFLSTFQSKEEAIERLSIVIDATLPFVPSTPPKPVQADNSKRPENSGRQDEVEIPALDSCVYTLERLRTYKIEPKVTYLDPWLFARALIFVCGWRGIGKTLLLLGLADAVSRGVGFGPWAGSGNPIPVLYFDGEMVVSDILERASMLNLNPNLFFLSSHILHENGLPPPQIDVEAWQQKIQAILKANDIKLFIIDNIASLTPGTDQNLKEGFDAVNQWIMTLRYQGITTILVHHTGKGGDQRGTSAHEDHMDISISMRRPVNYRTTDGCRFLVTFTKYRLAHRELPKIADIEFSLQPDENGRMTWTYTSGQKVEKGFILSRLSEGAKGVDIAEELGCTPSRVSQLKATLEQEGYLKGKQITQSGFRFLKEQNEPSFA